ncbi:LysE/ArgO family amino acid transporter [Jannaschia seohaensis]|uniref:L-lysine exporter family protein LysE/ArgO n=1 Tax=Jannaschia seohaensis TaxID=475081 RepID=A0A2Y9C1K0_9RHOB|nr:LysE/ArgO family amino acid transporter [Jannaschia seohaensis]PWJ16909.1 L-lysine exporter family protein LysE/ArgO [Jannaschia seohaensis]SSA48112.1 L-lysine exporter family protein LysE/ArgO [Jannaschia seohaensis]
MTAYLSGFGLGLSLILAIGAQNAFVLRQGLRGEHVLPVVLTCAVSDALLIAAGVAGFGVLVEAMPWIVPVLRWGAAAFLLAYGARAFRSAWQGGAALQTGEAAGSRRRAVAICLALTWLNPHVYLDTLVLLGSISTQSPDPALFGAGAITASFTFFFSLGFGATLLRPVFAKPSAWRALDFAIGLVMWALALSLVLG